MKKTLFLFVLLFALVSCDRKGEDLTGTTYKIINNMTYLESTTEYLDATLWDIIVYYYVGETMTGQESIDPISPEGGESEVISVSDEIEKIKISFKFLPPESPYYHEEFNYRQYTTLFSYLRTGGHKDIVLTDNTQVKTTLKSSGKTIIEAISEIQIRQAE